METRKPVNIVKAIFFIFIIYTILLLFIGRNLTFIPVLHFGGGQLKAQPTEVDTQKTAILEKFLKGEKGSYSIYYKNLKTNQTLGIDENEVLTAASVNKLPIVAYMYHLASQGKINLEDSIVIQDSDIQNYGTGSIQNGGSGQSYSLKTLAKLALEQSDNTAAHVLGVKLDLANVQDYMNSLGLTSTDMANDMTTASDMGKLLELIWNRKIANNALTLEMLDFMHNTDIEDRLPANLPKRVTVYHKTGDAIAKIHDVGIIDDGKNTFVLAVLTSDITDEGQAKSTIAKIASFLYGQQH